MRKAGDVYIDNQPLSVTAYQRGTTEDMAAKFGSSEQGQTNLDLFKAKTQKSWRGGMFQKNWTDDQMAGFITGFHHNPLDDKLYLTPEMHEVIKTNGGMDPNGVTAWCFFNGLLYIAFQLNAPSADTNGMVKINLATDTVTGITLPANISGSNAPISSLTFHGQYMYLAGQVNATGFGQYRMTTADAFTRIATSNFKYHRVFRDKLYAISHWGALYLIGNETGPADSATGTLIKTAGVDNANNQCQGVEEYNGALYIRKPEGLFRYDGTDVYPVLNFMNQASNTNFTHGAVFNGRYYYTIGNILYEFDGINITTIQDFSDGYNIIDLSADNERLYITVRYNTTSSALYESENFPDPITTPVYTYGLFTYNGIAFYEYKSKTYTGTAPTTPFGETIKWRTVPVNGYILWFCPDLYFNGSLQVRSLGWIYYKQQKTLEFKASEIGTTRTSEVIGSVYDAQYPSVPKALNAIMAEYESIEGSNVLLTIDIRTTYKGVLGDWENIFRSDNVSAVGAENDYFLHDQVYDVGSVDLETYPHIFHKIEYRLRVNVTGVLTSPPRIQTLTYRYTLQPRMRRTWALSIPVFGIDPSNIESQYEGDGSIEERTATKIRSIIYDAYENKLPVLFYDIDYSAIKTTFPLEVKGQDWIKDGDYLAIKQSEGVWMNRRVQTISYTTDKTEISLDSIGHREDVGGSSSATITVNDEVRKSYAVYVKRIQNERIIIDENTVNDESGYSDLSSELIIELVEA